MLELAEGPAYLWGRVEQAGKLIGKGLGVDEAGVAPCVRLGGVHLIEDGLDGLAVAIQGLQIPKVWLTVEHQLSPGHIRLNSIRLGRVQTWHRACDDEWL